VPRCGTITVVAAAHDDWVDITVRDTGEGIPAENLEQIFEPLFTTKAAAPVSASPWYSKSSCDMAGASKRKARSDAARHSRSRCRWRPASHEQAVLHELGMARDLTAKRRDRVFADDAYLSMRSEREPGGSSRSNRYRVTSYVTVRELARVLPAADARLL
jgi:hypothetical protein